MYVRIVFSVNCRNYACKLETFSTSGTGELLQLFDLGLFLFLLLQWQMRGKLVKLHGRFNNTASLFLVEPFLSTK